MYPPASAAVKHSSSYPEARGIRAVAVLKAERVGSKESNGEKAVSATAVMSLLLLQRGGVAVDDDEPSSEEAANCSEVCTDWPGKQHVAISVTIQ
uniref:Uncharacterized protein n=1 Tax=Oryza punctata TaxID=4537 RepID=A0A0E0K8X3_ORYPU